MMPAIHSGFFLLGRDDVRASVELREMRGHGPQTEGGRRERSRARTALYGPGRSAVSRSSEGRKWSVKPNYLDLIPP